MALVACMFRGRQLTQIMLYVSLLLVGALLLQGCDDKNNKQWEEEIQLSDGNIVWIKRTAHFERTNTGWLSRLGDAASRGRIMNMELTIDIPETAFALKPPIWRFNAVPLLLDYDKEKKTWIIVGGYFYCDSWEAAGEPALNRWQYVVKDGQWIIQALDKKYVGRVTNMYLSFTKLTNHQTRIGLEEIEESRNSSDTIYKTIMLREQRCNNTVNFEPKF